MSDTLIKNESQKMKNFVDEVVQLAHKEGYSIVIGVGSLILSCISTKGHQLTVSGLITELDAQNKEGILRNYASRKVNHVNESSQPNP